jgi:hypothetical protein
MRSWQMKGLFLGMALLLSTPMTATAQGTLGVGLSFLGDEGGTGFTVDYAAPFRTMTNDRTLSWVGDFSFHRNNFDSPGFDGNITTLTFQGGVRIGGPIGTDGKLTWHGQGLVGIVRQSFDFGADDLNEELCDLLDIDCEVGDSDSTGLFTPGGGINYWFNPQTAFRAQLDIPIGFGEGWGSNTRFWIGISRQLGTP